MDQNLKEKLDKALSNGKDAINSLTEIVKIITKEMAEHTRSSGQDIKITSTRLFKEILNSLAELGKNSLDFIKAATIGFKEGLKESTKDDNNLLKHVGDSLLDGLKNIGEAGIYVTKETAKNIAHIIETNFKKSKE